MNEDKTTLLCPKCQEPIPITLDQFKVVGCKVCGTTSALNKDGQLEITHTFQAPDEALTKLLKPGKQLQYRKTTYRIASLFVYHVDYKEWDEGSPVQGYGFIREWYAYDQQGNQLIIMMDTDKKYYLVSNPIPVKPNIPLKKRHAIELGKYQFQGLIGMDNEALDAKGFYRIYGHTRYECADENFEKATILQYQLTRLTGVQIKRMVILDEEDKLKAAENFTTTTYYRNVFGLALLITLILLIFNLGQNKGKMQSGQYVSFMVTTDSTGLVVDTVGVSPQSAGVFDLVKDQNYRLKARCYLQETNQYVDYSLTMVREKDAAVVGDAALSFYTESGHDDEGYWEENLLEDKLKFQVDQTGKYQIFIAPDYENLWQFPAASLEVQIEPAPYTFFYLCISAFFLLLWLIFQWQRENIVAFANLPHDTILHDIYESR